MRRDRDETIPARDAPEADTAASRRTRRRAATRHRRGSGSGSLALWLSGSLGRRGRVVSLGSNAQGSDATGGPADAPAKTLLPGEDTGFDPPADGAARRAAALRVRAIRVRGVRSRPVVQWLHRQLDDARGAVREHAHHDRAPLRSQVRPGLELPRRHVVGQCQQEHDRVPHARWRREGRRLLPLSDSSRRERVTAGSGTSRRAACASCRGACAG